MRKSENYNILGHNYDIRSLNKSVELLRKAEKSGIEKNLNYAKKQKQKMGYYGIKKNQMTSHNYETKVENYDKVEIIKKQST